VTTNPYQPPTSNRAIHVLNEDVTHDVSPVILEHMRATRPWVRFCSLAGYITALFIIVVDLITVRKMIGYFPLYQIILLNSFYLIMAALFIIPSFRLSRYEKSITRLIISNQIEDLEQAIAHQRSFWRQMGIMILMILIIYLFTLTFSAIAILSSK
jgi:predicted neutral ceramidase superfamily lipid hydrolase